MTRRKIVFAGSLVVACILLAIALVPMALQGWRMRVAIDPNFTSSIEEQGSGVITGVRVTYSKAYCGIVEIGDTRLLFPDVSFSGSSSDGIVLSSNSQYAGMKSVTGAGLRRFTTEYKQGKTTCTFAGVTFTVADGNLYLDGQSYSLIDGTKEAIFVNENERVIEVVPIESNWFSIYCEVIVLR